MNEVDTLLAAKVMKQFTKRQAINPSEAEELVSSFSEDGNSLHLSINKSYADENKPVDEMTLLEYRAYVEDKISCFIMHPSQKKVNYTIHITETGLLGMKSDRKYEKHVFNTIRAAFMQSYFSPFSENCLLYFDDLDNSMSMSWTPMKGIRAEQSAVASKTMEQTEEDTSFVSFSKVDEESQRKNDNRYIFKRITPVSMLIPPSRYTKALYAYNIAPDNWPRKRSFEKTSSVAPPPLL